MEKIYPDKHGNATFRCPHCSFERIFDAAPYRNKDSRITIRCLCGERVPVLVEFRKFYRKPVQLHGECFFYTAQESFPVEIDNLSLHGASFSLLNVHDARSICIVGDQIMLRFLLDSPSRDIIERRALLRNVQEQRLGTNFLGNEYDKDLGFYLMR